jgi:UDP-N-acetylmuramoyl-tripeptide--D-alanyl-D-alanine ligase
MQKYTVTELAGIIKAQYRDQGSGIRGQKTQNLPNTHDAIRTANLTTDNRPPATVSSVSIDSRTVKTGDCFFAIVGKNFDGHNFVSQAFEKGAVCAVVDRKIKTSLPVGANILLVRDTTEALGDLAWHERQNTGTKVVAITGSVGKTTTRQIVFKVLSEHFRVHQAPKSFNNNIGLPLTILEAKPDDQIIVVELGTNHPGEISYLTNIACPDIALVTNVHPAHLAGFGSLAAIADEKLSISEGLSEDGILIINADCEVLVRHCQEQGINYYSFGQSQDADFRVENISNCGQSSQFTVEGLQINLPLPGPGNVENATAAWAVCSQFGITIEDFASAVSKVSAAAGRAELLQLGTLTVLNDCYNANPASMKNALAILSGIDCDTNRRRVFICGDMGELGEQSEALHIALGEDAAKAGVNLMISIGKLAKIAAESAKAHSRNNLQINCYDDTISACNNLHDFIKDYDIVLVKASRAAALEAVVAKLKEIYSPGSTKSGKLQNTR